MAYPLSRIESESPQREEIFLLQNVPDWLWGSLRFPFDGYPEIKQPECEVDNSPPSSAEVKDECNYTSTSTNIKCLHGCTGQLYLFLTHAICP
jgi:hypothetical protein